MKTERYEVMITTYADGGRYETWRQNGKLHRLDGPAITRTYESGERDEIWYRDGEVHRDNGPAAIYTYENGDTKEVWYRDGKRIDPPKEDPPHYNCRCTLLPKEDPYADRTVTIDGREYHVVLVPA